MQHKFANTPKALRRLLQLDRPLKTLNTAEADQARQDDFRWNFFFNSFDVIFFLSGISLLSATTILPLFISKLSTSPIPLAIVAMMAQGGFFLPQLLTANFIERLDHKKPMVVSIGFFSERVPLLLLPIVPLFALRSPQLALILFLFLYSWFSLGGGVVAPAWQDMIARCFPPTRRGRFFGTNLFIGTLLGIGAAQIAGRVLENVSYPQNFVWIFGVAGFSIFISWISLIPVKEPIEPGRIAETSTRQYFAELPSLLRADQNFRNFLIARFFMSLAEMGNGFLTVAAILTWSISDGMVAQFTVVLLIGQTAASLMMGFLADRYGHRLTLQIALGALVLAFAGAWLASDPSWYFAVFFLLGFFTGAKIVSGTLVVLEFCAPAKRPTYVGVANTLSGIGSMTAPLIGAGLAWAGYNWLFAASMAVSAVAFLMLSFWVKEPRFVVGETGREA
ncbi:MAG: MFS family permease [Cellvibrionaceae bacterium]|jgi:MFS family permease